MGYAQMKPVGELRSIPFFVGSIKKLDAKLIHGIVVFIIHIAVRLGVQMAGDGVKQSMHKRVDGFFLV